MVRADDTFGANVLFLIKMPLESVEISRVNVEGDNINLTAADVDSFDVAGGASSSWQGKNGSEWRIERKR